MKKEEILAKTAELLTAGWIAPFDEREFEAFSKMPDEERRIYIFIDGKHLPNKIMFKLYKKEDNIVLARKVLHYKFMRNRFFIMSKYDTLFTITPKRVFMNDVGEASYVLRGLYNFDSQTSIKNSTELRKFILKGKLPEPLYYSEKARIKSHFGPTELKVFTTNEEIIIDRMMHTCGLESLIGDMIFQCKALNVKINSEWSDRRLRDQHQIWNDTINKYRHKNCKNDLIWDTSDIVFPEGIELINSEKRCAEEGDNMHHCLYNCYWRGIDNKDYMAFHVESDTGDFTVGIIVKTDNTVRVDQAYKAYNKIITREDQSKLDEVLELAQEIINANIKYDDYTDFQF